MTTDPKPPVAKYELTLVLHGNSHEELESELLSMTRGGYLLDSDYHRRDDFHVIGVNGVRTLRHTNPQMTPERYAADLETWWQSRKART